HTNNQCVVPFLYIELTLKEIGIRPFLDRNAFPFMLNNDLYINHFQFIYKLFSIYI
ncbi:hypothetical protein HMPREF1988_00633, partial [Porphyromonas gingivalis F0185]